MARFQRTVAGLLLVAMVAVAIPRPVNAATPKWVEKIIYPLVVAAIMLELNRHADLVESTVIAEARESAGWFGRWLDDAWFHRANQEMCGLVDQGYARAIILANSTLKPDESELALQVYQLEYYCGGLNYLNTDQTHQG